MIRRARLTDIDICTDLAVEFFDPFLRKHGMPTVRADVRKVAVQTITKKNMLIVERDGQVKGMAGWEVLAHPANSQIKIFYETVWCVKSKVKTDVLLLLRSLERIAREVGADLLLLANLSEEHEAQLKRIFIKQGFTFLESHYSKMLKRR